MVIQLMDKDAKNANECFLRYSIKPTLQILVEKIERIEDKDFINNDKINEFVEELEKTIDVLNYIKYMNSEVKPQYIHEDMEYVCELMLKEFLDNWFRKESSN